MMYTRNQAIYIKIVDPDKNTFSELKIRVSLLLV